MGVVSRHFGWTARVSIIVLGAVCGAPGPGLGGEPPDAVVIISVDALRADRLSVYGHSRDTSPAIDALIDAGFRFDAARTMEPLTGPAMCSMITGIEPHEHGATRNGLRMRDDLESLPRMLSARGWTTAAFVSNWTLRDELTRLGEHFDVYEEVYTRRRWFGLLNREATAEDVTDEALDWVGRLFSTDARPPLFLWVHYVEPHAPYRFHDAFADRLGITERDPSRSDRYDTEVAAVDRAVDRLVAGLRGHLAPERTLVIFTADHGESLGEHDYWGHGRYLYEPSLRIPLGMTWPGTIAPGATDRQASILDVPATVLGLIGLDTPAGFDGISWADAVTGGELPSERALCYQAHKGAVHGPRDADRRRSKGLLSVAVVEGSIKEILRVKNNRHSLYDLAADPVETNDLVTPDQRPSEDLLECVGVISEGLGSLDRLADTKLDDETVDQLRALGYID
jgi:arylsulfatase A-like enzyme